MDQHEIDLWHMRRALELAVRGRGLVEPNPMVGCVSPRGRDHRRGVAPTVRPGPCRSRGPGHGGPSRGRRHAVCHARTVLPLRQDAALHAGRAGRRSASHRGGPARSFSQVQGGGIAELRAAGVEVDVGLLAPEARRLNAPYLKLVGTGRPWIIAKWAMTLDGKIATRSGESRWISNPQSRQIVHALRGRVDAIMVGRGTVAADDPLLTARPPGPRTAVRVVLDTLASMSSESQLVRTGARNARAGGRRRCITGRRSSSADRGGLRSVHLPRRKPRGPAGRSAAGIGPPTIDERVGRRGRAAGQSARRTADRRGVAFSSPRNSSAARRPARR